ncbi:putative spore protein YtfJ [Anaerosolibacter carboniphilus]|uniref:Putative spore protein YtfJ n=1 Tax=Anaerosolibacter carboniphilus TaxID=1417629 RepID=A0A841KKC7_9FIRM|nr:spore germination protein GerW family protein [Anaerosolibacter carboniphilus]MBB6214324.1 putative spore protein YtfJ [Anaerosolibacter carboniphilus]
MDINNTMEQNVSTLFSNIESFAQQEGTLGKPISVEDKTLIPVISVSIGYGGGNSSGKLTQGSTTASQGSANTGMDALGLGARISTDAVLIVDQGNISAISINTTSGAMNQLMNKLPQMVGMGQNAQQQGQQQGQQQQGQQQNQ